MNEDKIVEAISKVTQPLDEAGVEFISAQSVATAVMEYIDPDGVSPAIVDLAARLHITEIARRILAKRHDPEVKVENALKEGQQGDFWSGVLQERYPVNRKGSIGYVLREKCTDAELIKCAARMKKAGQSLVKHANALLSYVEDREDSAVSL